MQIQFERPEMESNLVPGQIYKDCWLSVTDGFKNGVMIRMRAPQEKFYLTENEGRVLLALLKEKYE